MADSEMWPSSCTHLWDVSRRHRLLSLVTSRWAGVVKLRTIQGVIAAIVSALAIACGSANQTAPSAPPQSQTGSVEGIVNHESYLTNRIVNPAGPMSGARVVVTEGPGVGATVTTGADGVYHFDLPPGPFRVRWSAEFFETRESDASTVQGGATTKVATVTLRLQRNVPVAEWSISGLVLDGRGSPVPDALAYSLADMLTYNAAGQTDAAGRFHITSTRQHPDIVGLTVEKRGYTTYQGSVACVEACTPTVTVRLLRIVREWLDGPSSMRVGDVVPVDGVTEYDDGSRVLARAFVESSNPSVVQVQPFVSPYEHVYVKALAPGTATLSAIGGLSLQVRVYP